MLRPTRLKLKNWCQHRELDLELRPGIFSVTGPNGSGKSNLARALLFALTGEVQGADRREDMLSWGAERGQVELDLDDGAGGVRLVRTLHDGKHLLESKEGKLTRKTEVNERVSSLIGMDVKLLPQVVFVPQGELDRVLRQEHGERARLIGRLFRLDDAEGIRDELLAARGKVASLPVRAAEISELELKCQGCRDQMAGLGTETSECDAKLAGLEQVRPTLEAALQLPCREDVEASLEAARSGLRSAEQRGEMLAKELAQMPRPVQPAPAGDDQRARAARELPDLTASAQRAAEALAKHRRSPPEPAAARPEELAGLAGLRAEAEVLARDIELAKAGKCPQCRRDFIVGLPEQADMQVRHAQLTKDCTRLAQVELDWVVACQRQSAAQARWQADLGVLERSAKQLAEALQVASKLADGFDLVAYYAQVEAGRAYAMVAGRRLELEREHQIALLRAEAAKKDLTALEAKLGASVPREQVEGARGALQSIRELEQRRNGLRERLAGMQATLASSEQWLAKCRTEELQREANQGALAMIDKARDLFHPDKLPRAAALLAIRRLNRHIARYIGLFHAPFTLELADDMDFRVGFPERGNLGTAALSGGQRVVAALAFRFGLAEMLTSGCGLMVLDEPTAYLDESNQRSLLAVLQAAAEGIRAQNVTVLVPTHEETVASACSGNIEVHK